MTRLATIGATATIAHRESAQSAQRNVNTSSFGLNTRQANAVLRQTYLRVLQTRAHELLDAETDQLAVYEPMKSKAHSVSMTLQRIEHDNVLAKSVLRARDFERAVSRAMLEDEKKDEEFAAKWRSVVGTQAVREFLQISPLYNRFQQQLNVLPDRCTKVVTLTADLQSVARICKTICLQSRFNNLFKAMNGDWRNRCKVVLFNECTPIEDEEKKRPTDLPSCYSLRMCICSSLNGRKTFLFTNRARASFKQTFKRNAYGLKRTAVSRQCNPFHVDISFSRPVLIRGSNVILI